MKDYLPKCGELTKQFGEVYPAGHTNARVKFNATEAAIFAARAEGSHVWDMDGNEYIEYINAYGPLLLGHRHPRWIEALKNHLDNNTTVYGSGIIYGENDILLANKLIKHIPCAEAVKLCTTGTEAVQTAIRIARAYSEKDKILRFESFYHGWVDNIYINKFDNEYNEEDGPLYKVVPKDDPFHPDGVSPWVRNESFVIPYNNFEILEKTIEKYHDEIGMCLVEPMASDVFCMHPLPGYLERLRELCTKNNIVLCFDEVITGFRLGLGGAQTYFGVTPDICTLGKSLGGGLPVAAIVGKKEVMNIFKTKNVVSGGTFNGFSLGVTASLAAVSLYEELADTLYSTLEAVTDRLIGGMHEICKKYNVAFTTSECTQGGIFNVFFGIGYGRIKRVTDVSIFSKADYEFYDTFWQFLQEEGILIMFGARWFIGGGHTMEDIEKTLKAVETSLVKTLEYYKEKKK